VLREPSQFVSQSSYTHFWVAERSPCTDSSRTGSEATKPPQTPCGSDARLGAGDPVVSRSDPARLHAVDAATRRLLARTIVPPRVRIECAVAPESAICSHRTACQVLGIATVGGEGNREECAY